MPDVVIRAFRVSGFVPGPCTKCGKEERGLVMFEDYALGWECLACGEIGRADRVEWIEGKDPAISDLVDEEE
ncbi:MAG: hypothetical protein E6K08_04190 [Methanobacteriota archaeon]|nr:MAG: hypothetical protein E6K08_04190 [Euryarchaeota archaeon]TLZ78499.1 MAG: hypothetical protein E6K11_08680 [Euryarchaeota archaeon]